MDTIIACPKCRSKRYLAIIPIPLTDYCLFVCKNWHFTFRYTLRF